MAAFPLSNAALTHVHKPLGLSPLPSSHPQHLAGRPSEPMTRTLVPGSGAARGVRVPSWDMGGQTLLCESPQQRLRGRGDRWLGRADIPRHSVWEEILPGLREPPARCWSAKAVISTFSNDFAKKIIIRQKLLITEKYPWVPVGLSVSVLESSAGPWPSESGWGPLRALYTASPAHTSEGLCGCVLRLLPEVWTHEGDLCDKLRASFRRVSAAKAKPLLPSGGKTWSGRCHLGTRHPRSILSTTLVNW